MKTPYYDPVSDTIANAPKYSYAWFHEKRHQEQYKRFKVAYAIDEIGMVSYTLGGFILLVGVVLELYKQAFILIGIISSVYIILANLLEIDAYIFGTINYLKHRRNMLIEE